jgi:hypothetical protein
MPLLPVLLAMLLCSHVAAILLTVACLKYRDRRKIFTLNKRTLEKRVVVCGDDKVSVDIPVGAKIIWDRASKRVCKRCQNGDIIARIRYKIVNLNKKLVTARPLTCFYYCNKCAFKGVHLGKKAQRLHRKT